MILGVLITVFGKADGVKAESLRPNLLFIAVDDLTTALSCYGDAIARTPHIDRLAARGVLFDRAYNQLPLCNPTRASVMTGLRPDRLQVYDLERHFRDELPDVVTLPQAFRKAGYRSVRIGKIYHYNVPAGIGTNGLDDDVSWDVRINPKGRDVHEEGLITNAEPHRPVSAALSWLAAEGTDDEQTDGMIVSEAVGTLETHDWRQPLFLAVGFFRPHTPYVAPRRYFEMYPVSEMALPFAPDNDRDDIPVAAFAHNCPVPNYGLDEAVLLKSLQAYYACVSFVDAQIGRLLAALEDARQLDRTVTVLWSDHGYHLGEHQGIWQKRTLFEQAARSPLIVAAPGRSGNGQICRRVVEFVDIYPTLSALCGVPAPSDLAGRDLTPLLNDPLQPWESDAVTQILRPADSRLRKMVMGRSIRTERWRFTDWDEGRAGVELYDHHADPGEFENLAINPSDDHAAVIRSLKARLDAKASGQIPRGPVNPAKL
ncbi:MAG: sulfatase [Planctomycetaceae bacterium]|nr:sulfatase [Planctomycetaceae bacterium]